MSPGLLYLIRNKTGILGWRSEKTEMVNGYEAKVRLKFPRLELPTHLATVSWTGAPD
jgi:hypothetical protein